MYYQNVRGLGTKTSQILLASQSIFYDILALSETWLNDSIMNGELFDLSNFSVFRSDRSTGKRGGGVLLALRSKILTGIKIELDLITDNLGDIPHVDLLLVKVFFEHRIIYILTVYIPPNSTCDNFAVFSDILMSLNCIYGSDLIVIGDFNISEFLNCEECNTHSVKFDIINNLINYFELKQFNRIAN